jgi:surface protein
MFEECILLESLNLSTFNTKIIEDARHLLNECINIKDIDFSNIDSSNIK